jgi:LacI family transcriptional regulator
LLGLQQPATAIFATNPMTALGIMRRAQERGIDVPRDLSVVGVDDSDVRMHVWPRLTAVTQDASALGLEAALWLTRAIAVHKTGALGGACRRTIATSFEVNGTTAVVPGESSASNAGSVGAWRSRTEAGRRKRG